MRVAALDLGSNTFLLLIADVDGQQIKSVQRDLLTVTRLGQGVHANKEFHPEALSRARECLKEYKKVIDECQADVVLAMATSAARDVTNSEELFSIGKEVGIPIRIIPGEKEAELTYFGSTTEEEKEKAGVAVIDVGGGSTEIIGTFEDGSINGSSVDVGSVRLTEMFVSGHPILSEELKKIENYIDEKINEAELNIPKVQKLIAVAGTPTTLACIDQAIPFDPKIVDKYNLSVEKLKNWTERLATMTLEERKALPGMDPKRADVIVTGATILRKTAEHLNMSEIEVSIRGVRYGIASLWEDLTK